MGLKSFDYYNNVPMAYPNRDDYTTVFVYNKGKVIVNGVKRSAIDDSVLADYAKQDFKIEKDFDRDAYYEQTKKYSVAQGKLNDEFMTDLFDEHGVTGHPKVAKAFTLAWDYGHSAGYQEVANYFDDLADLLKP